MGANHVICILQSKEVEDEAVITFTDDFYSMVFKQNMQVCKAFKQAQLGVRITHGEFQANIFKLLTSDVKKMHKCNKFGPFPQGKTRLIESNPLIFKNTVPKVPSLRGR